MDWKDRVIFFDIEIFKEDFIVCFKNYKSGERYDFVNDYKGIEMFMRVHNPLLIGYNNKSYDNYILKAILCGGSHETLKDLNDWIIAGNYGWEYYVPYDSRFDSSDLMLDLGNPISLKEIMGNMGLNIMESSVPFDIDRKLTDQELKEVLIYCRNDVDALIPLFESRLPYLQSKIDVGDLCGIPYQYSLYWTNSQLAGKFLSAKFVERTDERDYKYPNEWIKRVTPPAVNDFIELLKDKKIPSEKLFKNNLDFIIANCNHTFGFGGLHGALPKYMEQSTDDRVILISDVTSYYPSLILEYGYMSRNVASDEQYRQIYHDRLKAKAEGNTRLADAYKLILNITYGSMLNKYSSLYDPLMARSICITGQLFLIYLVQILYTHIPSFISIQSNTDGIIFSVDRKDMEKVNHILQEWQDKCRFTLETEEVSKIIQKDVNNYILLKKNGKIKTKGGYVSDYNPSFSHNSMNIVSQAIIDYFINDVPVNETIESCSDPLKFQIIAKAGRTYQKVIHEREGI